MNTSDLIPPTDQFTTPEGHRVVFADEGDGHPLLLIMGINLHLVHWPPSLVGALRGLGMRVIRFDNRDCGASGKFDHLGAPSRFELMIGGRAPYALEDMAADGFALMDHLGLERVHLCGVSMGGMIAQVMALQRPERFMSLGLLMTTPGGVYMPSWSGLQVFLSTPATSREGVAARFLANQQRLAGFGAPPLGGEEETLALGRLIYDRSGGLPRPEWFLRQFAAVRNARPRKVALRKLRVPTRVVHGALDPLVPANAGYDLARLIPHSELHVIARLGHVMPGWSRPRLAELIAGHARSHAS